MIFLRQYDVEFFFHCDIHIYICDIIQIYSGTAGSRVLIGKLYTQKLQKLIALTSEVKASRKGL